MAFAITANFLLGTYQGSDSGGRPEPYPSPDRLYKACVAAAYNTFDFERQTDDRVLTDEQIVAYDINDDRRRDHVAKILRRYGERLQYSVFFLRIRPAKMLVVQNLIEVEIDGSTDSVVVCFLGKEEQAREGMSFLGRREYSDLTIPTVI